MSRISLFLICTFIALNLAANKFSLEPVIIIGNDEDDKYTFLKINSIHLLNDNKFIVGDNARCKITLYDAEGKFVKRNGAPGRAPNEFKTISSINSNSKYIYTCDTVEQRMNIYDKELNYIDQVKVKSQPKGLMKVYDNNSFLTYNTGGVDSSVKRIVKLKKNGEIDYCFFDRVWQNRVFSSKYLYARSVCLTMIVGSCKNNKIVFGFNESDNPADIFVYSDKGKELLYFTYRFKDDRYKFPTKKLHRKGLVEWITSMEKGEAYRGRFVKGFAYKNYYVVFMQYVKPGVPNPEINYNMFLVFDSKGKLLHEEDMCNGIEIYDMNSNGYIIGSDRDEEPVKIHIYKLSS